MYLLTYLLTYIHNRALQIDIYLLTNKLAMNITLPFEVPRYLLLISYY